MKHLLSLLFFVLVGQFVQSQNLLLEGHIRNLAGEPVAGAALLLNTPSAHQATTDSAGFYRFSVNEFPTPVFTFSEDDRQLQPGKIMMEFFEVSGRKVEASEAELLPGGQISGFSRLPEPETGKLYIVRITDAINTVFSRKMIYHSTRDFGNENFLKSTATDEFYDYEITIQPDTENPGFATVTLPVEGFKKTYTSHTQDFAVNEFPVSLVSDINVNFSDDTLTINADEKFKTDDNLTYSLVSADGSALHAKVDGSVVKVYGTTACDLIATDSAGNTAGIPMNFEKVAAMYSINISLADIFSDAAITNDGTVKLWDGIDKVIEPTSVEGNLFNFKVANKDQFYQVMFDVDGYTERNAFINMNTETLDTIMTLIPEDFNWETYCNEYQSSVIGFPMDLKMPKGVKPVIYMVNSKEYIKDGTNPDIEGPLKALESHFTEKKTFENFTYNSVDEIKDLDVRWINSVAEIPDFRGENEYFVALLINNKMDFSGGVSYIPKELTLGTALCEFQPYTNLSNYDHLFKEEVGTALVGATNHESEDGTESIFKSRGPADFTDQNWNSSKIYSTRENLIDAKAVSGKFTDNDIAPHEGSMKDPSSMNFIFKTYQEAQNIAGNVYTRFKNFVNSKK